MIDQREGTSCGVEASNLHALKLREHVSALAGAQGKMLMVLPTRRRIAKLVVQHDLFLYMRRLGLQGMGRDFVVTNYALEDRCLQRVKPGEYGLDLDSNAEKQRNLIQVVQSLRSGKRTRAELVDATGLSRAQVLGAVARARAEGIVVKKNKMQYVVVSESEEKQLETALVFLRQALAGGSRLVADVEQEAAAANVSLTTLGRARARLCKVSSNGRYLKLRGERVPGGRAGEILAVLRTVGGRLSQRDLHRKMRGRPWLQKAADLEAPLRTLEKRSLITLEQPAQGTGRRPSPMVRLRDDGPSPVKECVSVVDPYCSPAVRLPTPPKQSSHGEKPAWPTARSVMALLEQHYEALGCYEQGWSDERVADATGSSVKLVVEIRENAFSRRRDALRAKLEAVRAELHATVDRAFEGVLAKVGDA